MTNEKFHALKSDISFLRPSSSDITFQYVKSNPKARRHQRGSFLFKITLKEMNEGEIKKHPILVFFQPDTPELYLHNIFKIDNFFNGKSYFSTKEIIIDASDESGKIYNSGLLIEKAVNRIKKAMIQAINAKPYWTLDRQGNGFYQVVNGEQKIGRFTFNFL